MMTALRTRFALGLGALALGACATTTEPAVARVVAGAQMSQLQADRVISAYHQRHDIRELTVEGDPLAQPKSLDDVLEILRRDQISLFPAGAKFAASQEGLRAKVLHAQIELSWGEGQRILSDLLFSATANMRETLHDLQHRDQAGKLNEAEKKELTSTAEALSELDEIELALASKGAEHLAAGVALAKQIQASAPEDSHGYRLIADYARIEEDWPLFDQAISKVDPASTGLLFLRGVEQVDRFGKRDKGIELFKQALAKDPKFTRAQVHLMLARANIGEAYAEYQKLRQMNPKHQIVMYAGEAISRAYGAWRTRMARTEQRINDAAQGLGPK